MRKINFLSILLLLCFLTSCIDTGTKNKPENIERNSHNAIEMSVENADKILQLPLHCIGIEYPNKLGQVLNSDSELKSPKQLRPIFYGCFDWHSSVHGYWSIVNLLKKFPELNKDAKITAILNEHITDENVAVELSFFKQPHNKNFERTYGWAWFFKLQHELYTWDNPNAKKWYNTLKPLEDYFIESYSEYLKKLQYPIRTGTHDNSAFSLALSHEYATALNKTEFKSLIEEFAKKQYINDINCPINYEPSGHDFLSPCLQEAWLMSKVLNETDFSMWLKAFVPSLFDTNFNLDVAKVSDRTDGHLVHLDGLNFSRATCLFEISKKLPELNHLNSIAKKHFNTAFPNISNDDYMGSHWLGSFALQALQSQ